MKLGLALETLGWRSTRKCVKSWHSRRTDESRPCVVGVQAEEDDDDLDALLAG